MTSPDITSMTSPDITSLAHDSTRVPPSEILLDGEKPPSKCTTTIKVITALAAVILAIGGAVLALYLTGGFGVDGYLNQTIFPALQNFFNAQANLTVGHLFAIGGGMLGGIALTALAVKCVQKCRSSDNPVKVKETIDPLPEERLVHNKYSLDPEDHDEDLGRDANKEGGDDLSSAPLSATGAGSGGTPVAILTALPEGGGTGLVVPPKD
jgi:hypothetical protein